MGYTVDLCELREYTDVGTEELSYRTIETIKRNEELLQEYDEFKSFLEENFDTNNVSEINVPFQELVEEFERSEYYYDFVESFDPMVCAIHITQYSPSDDDIRLLLKHCPNVIWVDFGEIFQGIGMLGAGIDFSDSLELAYYIIDGYSPIVASQRLTIGKQEWKVVLKAREIIKERGVLNMKKLLGECELLDE